MQRIFHQDLAKGRWFAMTLPQQLGNAGGEFERALKWKQKKQPRFFEDAAKRMLELLDLTASDPRWRKHRLRELLRLRETVCEALFGDSVQGSVKGLQKYFFQFAKLARSGM